MPMPLRPRDSSSLRRRSRSRSPASRSSPGRRSARARAPLTSACLSLPSSRRVQRLAVCRARTRERLGAGDGRRRPRVDRRDPGARARALSRRQVVEQENLGSRRAATGHPRDGRPYVRVLNSDAWVVGDAVERLSRSRRESRGRGGRPRLRNLRGRSSGPSARFRPRGGSRRSTCSCGSWRRGRAAERVLRRGVPPRRGPASRVHKAAAFLIRRAAFEEVGPFDEGSSCSARRPTGRTGPGRPGGGYSFTPRPKPCTSAAPPGAASRRRCSASRSGEPEVPRQAPRGLRGEHARRVILAGLRVRSVLFRGERGAVYRDAADWVAGAPATALLNRRVDPVPLVLAAIPLLAVARLLPAEGLGLAFRLAAASLCLLIPGALIARALRLPAVAEAVALSLGVLFLGMLATFALGTSILLTLVVLGVAAAIALPFALRRRRSTSTRLSGRLRVQARCSPSSSGGSGRRSAATRCSIWPGCGSWRASTSCRSTRWASSRTADHIPAMPSRSGTGSSRSSRSLPGVDPTDVVLNEAAILVPVAFVVVFEAGQALFNSVWGGVAVLAGQVAITGLAPGDGGAYDSLAFRRPLRGNCSSRSCSPRCSCSSESGGGCSRSPSRRRHSAIALSIRPMRCSCSSR